MHDQVTRDVMVEAPADVVWNALTDPAELAAWFGAHAEVDLRVGGAIRFRWPDGSERRGLVIDLDPPRRLAFRWRELRSGAAGLTAADTSVVAFTLDADDRGTRVTVTESPGVLGTDEALALAEHA
jgi:uncharacterized protein YndB with AHSA1/START domain